ncbi:MAG: right-handed parallel beta-helix repeat-containing protein, partial [Candidatus Sungbacteria bacterium]|nr:right-handed parallel beta-helix repeat-containing protein [Candidatus Sungbacteria bacterium]
SPEILRAEEAEGQKATKATTTTTTGDGRVAVGFATGTDDGFLPPPLSELVISPVYRRGPEPAAAYAPGAMDVVINEIAWAGTADAATDDEWIELYNRTSQSISLSGWVLRSATDEKPYISLSGTIAAGGYYLIERDDDNAISDVSADLAVSFGSAGGSGLIDTGEALILQHASTTIDQTPALNSCGANQWCGGSSSGRKTMERVDPDLAGTDSASWGSNDGLIRNGKSSGDLALNGTPKRRNSRNHYISQTNTLTSSTTIVKEKSPYFIDANGLIINSGVTLTVNPVVVIKFYTTTSDLIVNGTIKAVGTSADNIVFTSFRDDEYGGDLNGDATSTAPAAGDWRAVTLNSTSQNSEMSYVRMRYGGKWFAGQSAGHALLKADNASISVSNSIFETSLQYGIWMINSTSTIANSVVRNNSADYGLYIEGGAPVVQNNTLDQNYAGIFVSSQSTAVVSGNTITASTYAAVSLNMSTPTLSANSASANGINGITIGGPIIDNFTFTKNLPYVVDGTLTLFTGKTFIASAGAVFKGKNTSATFDVQGLFNVNGSAAEPVVFTSFKDDSYGGDANNDGAASLPAAGDWRFILYESTATTSAMNYGLVRYGGSGSDQAMLIDSARVDVVNSIFENNKASGLRLSNATSTINASTFRNHQTGVPAAGLYLENGAEATLSNSSFSNNTFGVYLTGASALTNGGGNTVSGNTFDSFPAGLIP